MSKSAMCFWRQARIDMCVGTPVLCGIESPLRRSEGK